MKAITNEILNIKVGKPKDLLIKKLLLGNP